MKILIWGELKFGGPFDIFRQLDYHTIFTELQENYHSTNFNVGNKVWIQGIVSALLTEDNELFFYNPDETWDVINEKYDRIVYSAANLLNCAHKELLSTLARLFKNSRIPVYVIAVGAQAKCYDEIHTLSSYLKKEISEFVNSIYQTGGEIACRGYFTKELLDDVCPNSAVVTGCPSLFQNGRDLRVTKKGEKANPILNGKVLLSKEVIDAYPECVYIDQDQWLQLSYDESIYTGRSKKSCISDIIYEKGKDNTELFLEGRIKVFYDVPEWHKFLCDSSYNFSLGSRIHGSIMSILSGIPAMVCAIDSRTREMAEFFDIPYYLPTDEKVDIQRMYETADYSKFNMRFPEVYDNYNAFLQKCGLVKQVNMDNAFWKKEMPIQNLDMINKRKELYQILCSKDLRNQFYFAVAPKLRRIVRRKINVQSIEEKYQ